MVSQFMIKPLMNIKRFTFMPHVNFKRKNNAFLDDIILTKFFNTNFAFCNTPYNFI